MTIIPMQPPGLLPENDRKDLFSRAYVQAIASAAGYSSEVTTSVDRDSIDLRISSGASYCTFDSPCLELQLKCTSSDCLEDTELFYDLSIKNYNDLRKNSLSPRLLVVVLVPRDIGQWIDQDEDQMALKKCAYWQSLKGMRPTTNTERVRIRIPRANVLNPDALHFIFERAGAGEAI